MTLVGAWLVQLIIGGQLAMGNISVYFVSYYRLILGYTSVDPNTFIIIGSLTLFFATPVFPLGNSLVDFFGNRSNPVILIGGTVAIALVLSCAYLHYSPLFFAIVYAVGMGIFKGLLQSALLRAGWSHLPKRKGLVSGCIVSSYGFGGFFFGMYSTILANPDDIRYEVDPSDGNKYLPPEVGERVPFMLEVFCLTWAIQIAVGICLISNYRKKPLGTQGIETARESTGEIVAVTEEEAQERASKEAKLLDILKSRKFLHIYSLACCHLFYGYFFTGAYKQYGKDYINDDRFLSIVGSTASLFNGFFKFLLATLLDYYPFRKVYGCIICLEIVLIYAVQFSVTNKWAFMLASQMTFMCDGSMMSMLPALTID
mmetsp:Transcript_7854/g.13170  ORF Transcript_7854/g.13170 Transcript_7854/m.13170 type:complete len:371 (+) Transcript_7854:199-1311(+)